MIAKLFMWKLAELTYSFGPFFLSNTDFKAIFKQIVLH